MIRKICNRVGIFIVDKVFVAAFSVALAFLLVWHLASSMRDSVRRKS